MFPRLPFNDRHDRLSGDAEGSAESIECLSIIVPLPYLTNLFRPKLRRRVRVPLWGKRESSLFNTILGIVPFGPKEKVAWVAASSVVALVTDTHCFWNWPKPYRPRHPVSVLCSTKEPYRTIPLIINTPREVPTLISAKGFDLIQKPINLYSALLTIQKLLRNLLHVSLVVPLGLLAQRHIYFPKIDALGQDVFSRPMRPSFR